MRLFSFFAIISVNFFVYTMEEIEKTVVDSEIKLAQKELLQRQIKIKNHRKRAEPVLLLLKKKLKSRGFLMHFKKN